MYDYPEIKTFKGLYLQRNSFTVPDGAMEQAMNCILLQDNRLNKTRGFYEYFTPSEEDGDLNNLFYYQNKLISIYVSQMAYYDDTGSYPNQKGAQTLLSGAAVSVQPPRVSHSVQANSNLYVTTDNGVLKLESYHSKIFTAGVPPALDLQGIFLSENGWFTGDSQVAYRIVFGRRDANGNLLLGAPSEQLVLTNSPVTSVAYTVSGGGPYTVTVTSPNHNLSTGMDIDVTNSTGSPALVNGTYNVTVVDENTFTFAVLATGGAGNLTYKTSRVVQLEFSVPSEIEDVNDKWFFQIYRTSMSLSAAVTPTPDYRLVEEQALSQAQIDDDAVFYVDDIDEALVSFAPELYTNPNSREGELQANTRPPKCQDVTLFKECVIYANTETRQILEVDVIDTSVMVDGSFIEIKVGADIQRFVAREGVGNTNVIAQGVSYADPLLTITYANHNLDNGDTVLVSNAEGTGTLPNGMYTILNATTNTFDVTFAGGTAVTYLEFQGVTDGTYNIFTLDKVGTVSAQLRNTARGIVKAVNRDDNSLVYANYVSNINDVPGKMQFQEKAFGDQIFVRADSVSVGTGFLPQLPDSFVSGVQVFSQNEVKPNAFYSSKVGEPEAVPIANQFKAGSQNAKIYRTVALRDSVIFLKADGIFRMTGDNPLNFNVTAIDNTVYCISANSVSLLNNQVYFLSNQGVCLVTESAVQILSRQTIEDVISPIIGKPNIEMQTGAVGYESDRTYRLSTIGPNDDVKTDSYIYNYINDTWTQFEVLFKQGVVAEMDTLFLITVDNRILRERKTQTRIDYCGQNYAVSSVSVSPQSLSAVILSSDVVPQEGDVILKDDVFNRIRTVTSLGSSNYRLVFRSPVNFSAMESLILYQGYVTTVTFAPFHAGQVGRMKQFAQMQFHTRTPSVTRMELTFSGYIYGGSETTVWESGNVIDSSLGWGLFPWGFVPWGQADSIVIPRETKPAPPIRIFIPSFQQRTTYIKTTLTHREAGESLDIQALDYAVRGYRERVSK